MKNKLYLLLTLAVTFVLAIAVRDDFIRFLLGFEVLLTLALLADRWALKQGVTARLRLPEGIGVKDTPFAVEVGLENAGLLPAPEVRVEVWCRDEYTGRTEGLSGAAMLDSRGQATLRFTLDCAHCGRLSFRLGRVQVWDHLGVFAAKCRTAGGVQQVSVLPPVPGGGETLSGGQAWQSGEGEGLSRRPGDDPGDTYDIREFREGDAVRRIHWKLSAKTDELMVRDFGRPMERTTLVLLDLRAEERPDRAAWDRFLERVAQVSAGLLAGGFAHEVIWYQPEGAGRCAMSVSNERELQWMLCPLVGASTYKGDEIGEEEQDTTEQDRAVIRIGLTGEARRTGGAER